MKKSKMKKLIITLVVALVTFSVLSGAVFAAESPTITEVPGRKIILEGSPLELKNVPIAIGGRTMLPLRELVVALGVPNDDEHIIYKRVSKDEQYVAVIYEQTKIEMTIGKPEAYINGERLELDAAPVIYKNSTYIPLRFVAEALEKKVVWVGESNTVLIIDQENYENISEIMKKSAEAGKNIVRNRMDMDVDMEISSGGLGLLMGVEVDALVDREAKTMYVKSAASMLGIEAVTEIYLSDNTLYQSDPLTGAWTKVVYTPEEYEMIFENQVSQYQLEEDDKLLACLRLEESENEDELVLIGKTNYISSFIDAFTQQSDAMGMGQSEAPEFDEFLLRIVLDSDTYALKRFTMEVSADNAKDGETAAMSITADVVYSDIDGDFEITVPEDVVKNAVESEPATEVTFEF